MCTYKKIFGDLAGAGESIYRKDLENSHKAFVDGWNPEMTSNCLDRHHIIYTVIWSIWKITFVCQFSSILVQWHSWTFGMSPMYWLPLWWNLFYQLVLSAFQIALNVKKRSQPYDELYYKYFHHALQWKDAEALCKRLSGNLATVSNPAEYQQLNSFLKYQNISHRVWIARKILTRQKSRLILFLLSTNKVHKCSTFLGVKWIHRWFYD